MSGDGGAAPPRGNTGAESVRKVIAALPEWVFRLLKLSPWHYHGFNERWENRTYPCSRWLCFRRSPAWRSFERQGRSWCDRHVPLGGDVD